MKMNVGKKLLYCALALFLFLQAACSSGNPKAVEQVYQINASTQTVVPLDPATSSAKIVLLTFDDGPNEALNAKILDALDKHKAKAIFFMNGPQIENNKELVKRVYERGHMIGNHSWSHPDLSQVGAERIRGEMDKVRQAVAELTGGQEMKFMRPPRGIFSDRMLSVCRELGYTGVFWSVAYKDWDVNSQRGGQYAYDSVMSQLHPGAVILLHSVSRDNVEALGRIIDAARSQGYEFKSLNELQMKTYR